MNNKKLNQFTLVDVIERKKHFTNTNTIFDKIEFKEYNMGKLMAYDEMLVDIKEVNENEFVGKYSKTVHKLAVKFENQEFTDEEKGEEISGYNNAIVSILTCINPIYEFGSDV